MSCKPAEARMSAAALLSAVLACLIISACGGSSETSATVKTVAAAARPSAAKPVGSAHVKQALAGFAACLRQNGVSLPAAAGSHAALPFSLKGLDPNSPGYRRALAACRPALIAAFKAAASRRSRLTSPSGAGSAPRRSAGASVSARIGHVRVPPAMTAILERFTACMRTNGVASFPQPDGGAFRIAGLHLDPSSPQYRAAEARCNPILQAALSKG